MQRQSRFLLIFYLLVAYVLIQFVWWAYLIYDLNSEILTHQETITKMHEEQGNIPEFPELRDSLSQRILMVVGEGSVFLVLMVLGIIIVQRTFKKEIALARQQKNFLLSVTHELNSPIASVKLYLQTLLTRDLNKEKSQGVIQNALRETDRLSGLVDNLLLATRIDNSTYAFHFESLNLSELVSDIITHTKVVPKNEDRITTNISPNLYFSGDKLALTSILTNLVENGLKYSPANTKVEVELTASGSNVILRVMDEGSGIPEKEKSLIFNKFYRVGNEETRKTKGTGLGLYITKYLVGKNQGTITVKDRLPKGTIFEITFKKAEASA